MKRSAAAILLCLVVLPLPAFAAPPPEDNLAASLQMPGLFDTVRVRRDVHDIPHIFAKNDRDVLFALGWIHAEDRFFQMDLLRRTFSDTLAELVGKDALASDVQLRTVGLRRATEASLPALSRSTEVWLESCACGVNAWLADTSHSLPAEYSPLELTRASIPAWTPVDSIVILKGVTFSLSFDLTDINRNVALSAFQKAGEAASFNGAVLFSEDVYRSAPFDPTASIPTRLREPRGSSASSYFARAAGLARLYREGARAVRLLRQALERKRDRGILIRDGTHTLRHEWLPLAHPQPGQAIPFDILPQAEMPHVINPKRGWVANANNDPIGTSNDNNPLNQKRRGGQGILYLGGSYFDRGFRIGQIERLLEAELAKDDKFSVEDFEGIQANNQLLDAQVFVPHILKAFQRARRASDTSPLGALAHDPRIVEAVDRLDDWDFSTPAGIQEGYDPFDLPAPAHAEIRSSVAATNLLGLARPGGPAGDRRHPGERGSKFHRLNI